VGGKGVRGLAGYFMGYYTMWLVFVKSFFVPFWELGKGKSGVAVPASRREIQNHSLKAEGCGTRLLGAANGDEPKRRIHA